MQVFNSTNWKVMDVLFPMELYLFKGKAKVGFCVMSMVQSYHNSEWGMLLFEKETLCV